MRRKLKKRPILHFIKKIFYRLLVIGFCLFLGWLIICLGWGIKKAVWQGKGNLNFVVQGDTTYLFSYHPNDTTLNIVSLPPNLFIETCHGFGEYKLENIYTLGEVQKKGGGEFLTISLQNFFHLPLDGYIKVLAKGWSASGGKSEEIERGNITSLMYCLITRQCRTNFSSWDLLRIFNKLRQLKFTQVRLIPLEEQPGMVKKDKLADGTLILRVETQLVDDFCQRYFTDNFFSEEKLKIFLVNATDYPKLGQKVNYLLTNSGVEVIATKDQETPHEESLIEYADPKITKSYTLRKIGQLLQIKRFKLNSQIDGDLRIILGEDFKKKFYQP